MNECFRIRLRADLLRVEARIRQLLQCESSQCAFLQSSEYARVKHSVLLRLANVVAHEPDFSVLIHHHDIRLHVEQDASLITLRSSTLLDDNNNDAAAAAPAKDAAEEACSGASSGAKIGWCKCF